MCEAVAQARHDVGRIVRARRTELGLTQEQLAGKARLNRWTVNRVESGESPTLGTLTRIADVFGVEVDELLQEARSA